MLKLKRVDALVKSCTSEALKDKVELHLYGHGPEEERLKQLAKDVPIYFHDFVSVEQVRDLMRAHDVYVFSSNASDGWGAVVSEALEEGMQVFGTVEAGASGTVLPPTHLFKAGDVKRLTELLTAELPKVSIGEWTAECAADVLQGIMNET
jgi:glycosyltransferase involved in cell wall biosynthesis